MLTLLREMQYQVIFELDVWLYWLNVLAEQAKSQLPGALAGLGIAAVKQLVNPSLNG